MKPKFPLHFHNHRNYEKITFFFLASLQKTIKSSNVLKLSAWRETRDAGLLRIYDQVLFIWLICQWKAVSVSKSKHTTWIWRIGSCSCSNNISSNSNCYLICHREILKCATVLSILNTPRPPYRFFDRGGGVLKAYKKSENQKDYDFWQFTI